MSDREMTKESAPSAAWDLRDMFRAVLAAIGLFVLAAVIMVGAMLLWRTTGLPSPSQGVQALAILSLEALLLIPAWRWGPGKYDGGWEALGLRPFGIGESAVLLAVSFGLILLVNAGWEVVRQALGLPGQPDFLPAFGGGWQGLIVALFVGGVVAPVAEEVFFRGYLYAGLREAWGVGWGMVASALIFSVVHVIPGVLPPIFVMGLIFAFLYERTRSVWPCIILHGIVNSFAFAAAYLAERYPELVSAL